MSAAAGNSHRPCKESGFGCTIYQIFVSKASARLSRARDVSGRPRLHARVSLRQERAPTHT